MVKAKTKAKAEVGMASKKRKRGESTSNFYSTSIFKKKIITINPNNFLQLVKTFGEMVCKMWSNQRFKSTVDPHLFVQAVSATSNKKFTIGRQADVGEFIHWLIHQLHVGIVAGSSSKGGSGTAGGSSIVHEIFHGIVEITTRRQRIASNRGDNNEGDAENEDNRYGSEDEEEVRAREEEQQRLKVQRANDIEEIYFLVLIFS